MHELEFPIQDEQWLIFNVDEIGERKTTYPILSYPIHLNFKSLFFLCQGYFRVNYDRQNWQLISQQLMRNHSAISVINRAQILDDSLNLAQAGLLDYEVALNLTNYLVVEHEYLPWESALASLKYISSMMSRSSGYGHFKVNFSSFQANILICSIYISSFINYNSWNWIKDLY